MAVVLLSAVMPAGLAQARPPTPDLADILKRLLGGPTVQPAAEPGTVADQGSADAAASEVPAIPEPGQVTVNETGLLDIHVRGIDIGAVLEMLSYEARANIVTTRSVSGMVSANLYAVTLEQALDALLTPNNYAYHVSNGTIFVGTREEIATLLPPATTRVFALRFISPSEAAAAIKAVLGADAKVVEGATDSKAGTRGASSLEMGVTTRDYVVVSAPPEQLAAVEQLLREIDRRPQQVLIEATVLRATLNETNELGVDFTMLGGVDFQNVNSTSNASADLTTGALPAADLQSTTFNINTRFAGNVSQGGFTFGLIKDNIAGFIRALEEVTDVVVVANPKIVALNKQEAEVIVGRRDGYLTTTVTETAAVQTVEFLETGTQIKFRPMIIDDRTVRLSVHPKDSNGGLTAANLPFEETTEAHADILVNDGHTVLIGGLFRERTVNARSQIPLLGNIPLLGLAFGSRSDQTVREEVIILLTVHIIKESAAEQEQYRHLLEDVERLRVGARLGLLGTGRERLAQAFYREALRQYEQSDHDRALLNVRMALTNQPKHLGAIKLKERLLGRRVWDDEGARMRTFIWELIGLGPDDSALPQFGRPAGGAASPTGSATAPEAGAPQ